MSWYKNFFENWYLGIWLPKDRINYLNARAKKEAISLKKILKLPKKSKILDLGCGHGRHTILLSESGYKITGLDLSQKALKILKEKDKKQKVRIIHGDMRKIPFRNEFDAAINMFTTFGYLENSQEDLKVLKSVAKSLKAGGKFIMEIPNKAYRLSHFQHRDWAKIGQFILLEEWEYDPKTNINTNKSYLVNGKKWHKGITMKLRLYSLSEIKKMMESAGLKIIKTYGDIINLKKFTKSSPRLIILSKKI